MVYLRSENSEIYTSACDARHWCIIPMCCSALQPWKWQLTGIGYSTAAQARGAHCLCNGLWTRSYAARCTTPQSATLGLHPVIHVPNYMDGYITHLPTPEGWMAQLAMLADR